MKNYIILFIYSIAILSCKTKTNVLKNGIYRAVIESPGGELPFGLMLTKDSLSGKIEAVVLNAQEKLNMDEAKLFGDSIRIPMEIFDAEIVAKVNEEELVGYWKKRRKKDNYVRLPFKAKYGEIRRFSSVEKPTINVSGKWETTFINDNGKDTTVAVGVFDQKGSSLTGTFLTTTGDYRFLEGNVAGDSIMLSCFDGTHLFLFKAKQTDQKLVGNFWSGASSLEHWVAKPNAKAALPDVTKLTFLRPEYKAFEFEFPDQNGKKVSINDEQFKDKVVVVQIMGSWCPNCMDETNFLAPWYKKNKHRGIEIIGLAFEKSSVLKESKPRLEKMIKRFEISYPILLSGLNDKDSASKSLPMLNKVIGFPTTIILDKNKKVRHIHTGFAGPGTGKYYDELISDFERITDQLIAEKANK